MLRITRESSRAVKDFDIAIAFLRLSYNSTDSLKVQGFPIVIRIEIAKVTCEQ